MPTAPCRFEIDQPACPELDDLSGIFASAWEMQRRGDTVSGIQRAEHPAGVAVAPAPTVQGPAWRFGAFSGFASNSPSAQPPTFAPTEVPKPGPMMAVPTAAPATVPPVG